MVALRIQDQDQQRGNGSSQPRQQESTPAERISGQYWSITRRRARLVNAAICFTEQAAMLPLQCSATIDHLNALHRAARAARAYLAALDPETTRQLRPYASIARLAEFEYLLAEASLTVTLFTPVCEAISYERVELHLYIRSLFPHLISALDDVTAQLAALLDSERSQSQQGQEARTWA